MLKTTITTTDISNVDNIKYPCHFKNNNPTEFFIVLAFNKNSGIVVDSNDNYYKVGEFVTGWTDFSDSNIWSPIRCKTTFTTE